MAEKEQVHADSSNDESPEPRTSRSQKRFKASYMSFIEMVEMVDILKRTDYDGKHEPYPNVRKVKIKANVVRSLHRNFGVRRSKDQLRKHWSCLKLREQDQYRKTKRVLQKSDVDVVEEDSNFTSTSAHILIGGSWCAIVIYRRSRKTSMMWKKDSNIIDVLGRI
ncbi:hypothetical protein AB205_0196520 [Aquarana catesbeiana]|uniref:Uncharacterized protein n=1 Tax=Aquarana catesbeiana TaxID=8400 RepID=A0A2G9SDZ1_AQUCT|nr:hypothetical protein AB205_0196520 [Aquarana catesbeiana]